VEHLGPDQSGRDPITPPPTAPKNSPVIPSSPAFTPSSYRGVRGSVDLVAVGRRRSPHSEIRDGAARKIRM
jgi:hypothetical protein